MYKAGSKCLLAKGTSIGSLKSLSSSSSVSESTGGKRVGQGLSRMQRSSSSLCLQDTSFESSVNLASSSSEDSLSLLCRNLKIQSESREDNKVESPTLHDAGGAKVAQYIILIALAMQIPNILDELIDVLDQNLRSIPLLVMLGIVPSMFWMRGHRIAGESTSCTQSNEELLSIIRSMASMHPVTKQQSYGNCRPSMDAHALDEWGHFAELDETALEEKDLNFFMSPSSSRRSSTSLGTLPEEAEEEEDFSF